MSSSRSLFFGLLCLPLVCATLPAQTTIQGNVHGTWTSSGNPYYVLADCTVPGGQALRIDPGVDVVFYEGVSMYVNGQLTAEGTPSQRIRFHALNAEGRWNTIKVSGNGAAPPSSRFSHCEFTNADTALHFYIQGYRDNLVSTEFSESQGTSS